MFVSGGQFYVFVACMAYGGIAGVLLSISAGFKRLCRLKPLGVISDILFCALSAAGFIVYSFALKFPALRAYMFAGVLLGALLYFKSFNVIVANIFKKLYNNIRKTKKAKTKDGRNENEKTDNLRDGGGGAPSRNTSRGDDLSTDIHKSAQRQRKRVRRRNRRIRTAD